MEKIEQVDNSGNDYKPKNRSGRVLAGLIIVCIGMVFLLRQMGFFFPGWVFSWPMILIAIGIYSGAHNSFRNRGWLVVVGIGLIFLAPDVLPEVNLWRFSFPALIIFVGVMIMFGSRRKKWKDEEWYKNEYKDKWKDEYKNHWKDSWKDYSNPNINPGTNSYDDYLEIVSVFSNLKKMVVSKTFKGGDIVNIFGGTELNLTQADIQGTVRLEAVQIFGGAKIIVPRNWKVVSDMVAIFGGMDDKRMPNDSEMDPTKVLIIEGVSIFGGIDIISI